MSAEQFQQLLAAMKAMFPQQLHGPEPQGGNPSGADKKNHLVAKHMRLDVFDGKPDKWEDWSFQLKVAVRSQNQAIHKAMKDAEVAPDGISEEADLPMELEWQSAQLFEVLVAHTRDEALAIVKSSTEMRGLEAWQNFTESTIPKLGLGQSS